jgi:hypothetical protein
MVKQILGIVFVFVFTAFAWVVLGTTVVVRTGAQDNALRGEVGQLWGTPQRQSAPVVTYEVPKPEPPRPAAIRSVPGSAVPTTVTAPPPANGVGTGSGASSGDGVVQKVSLEASDVDVALDLEHRRKGLLWYSTYRVRFAGAYRVANHTDEPHDFVVSFMFPTEGAIYDNFRFAVGGREVDDLQVTSSTVMGKVRLAPGESQTVEIAYGSQGLDEWWYDFGSNVSQVKNFSLTMHTNFEDIDFPQNAISPTEKTRTAAGWDLSWRYSNLLSGVQIGMDMPRKLNPGPWVSQISFFAPVSLFFFFFALFMFSTIRKVRVHPMNYFFIGAGFFSFHLLLAYLVDHVSIHLAFAICSVVSLGLVISYMRLVVGHRFAIVQVGISQFVYLVLFSYTFFFEKYTGLAVTILSVLTLFVVMQVTGRIDWSKLGERGDEPPPLNPTQTPVSATEG